MRAALLVLAGLLIPVTSCVAQPPLPAAPATAPTVGRFPFLEVDARAKQVRVECEALTVDAPLEFFCCLTGTTEHESVLRSKVRPSHLHAALLMLGLEPGEPVRFSEATRKWLPPHGPPLQITCEFEKDGKPVALPAYRLLRDFKTKREAPPITWIFAGSRMMPGPDARNDVYAADRTGYLVTVVNFDFAVIDIPDLASNANETLHWESNLERMPPRGTKVTMVIEPAGKGAETTAPAADASPRAPIDVALVSVDAGGKIEVDQQPVASADEALKLLKQADGVTRRARVAVANAIEENASAREVVNALSRGGVRFDVVPQAAAVAKPPAAPAATEPSATIGVDEALIRRLREKWQQAVAPHDASMREAATTHYEVINQLRREQQRLIDEADRVQRLIDELEKRYQDMTTPRPE
jgi:hypothetical protein